MYLTRPARLVLCALLLAAPLPACGGGGGGGSGSDPTTPEASLSGLYSVAELSATAGGSLREVEFGIGTADGVGSIIPTVGSNDGTTLTPAALGPVVPFAVAANGSLTLADETGFLTNDGSTAVAMKTVAGSSPNMRILLRLAGPYSLASLSGQFHMGATTGQTVIYTQTSGGYYEANGTGLLDFPTTIFRNASGTHGSTSGIGMSTAYALTPTGQLSVDITSSEMSTGGLTADGNFAVFAGESTGTGPRFLGVLLKVSNAATNAAFDGEYILANIRFDAAGATITSGIGTATADGAGNLTIDAGVTENEEGVVSVFGAASAATYTVAADGTLDVADVRGAISPDGRYGFLCGELDDGNPATDDDPNFIILIRR